MFMLFALLQIPITLFLVKVLMVSRAELRLPLQRERVGYMILLNSGLRMEIQSTSRPLVRLKLIKLSISRPLGRL